ncbi:MAG: type I restriction enzyme HsdR N-terminal domain-containing protein [Bacteroidales bacterium]
MKKLNFPPYQFSIRESHQKYLILDDIRKKYVVLTPEEWVRQHLIRYLSREKNYPPTLITIEGGFRIYNTMQRADVIVHNRQGAPLLIAECKSPEIAVTQHTFDQAARYNMRWKAPYLLVTNGLDHYCCRIDHKGQSYALLREIPDYVEIRNL